jgi:tripeptide aminopeptidase
MSLGIPAITIGGGGASMGAHSPEESFDTKDAYLGAQRALLVVVALAR